MADDLGKRVHDFLYSLPGKRGIDIPEDAFDRIHAHAAAMTLPVWGRHPTPEHMQGFYDAGAHQNPNIIADYYHAQPHPHAPSLTVGDFNAWRDAHQTWQDHAK